MQKIPTIFERDWEGDKSRVLDQIVPGCEWVFEGEGKATRKYDGTCMMYDGKWWARREVKDGKTAPPGFVSIGHDHLTLKNVGWQPIEDAPFAKFAAEAIAAKPDFAWDHGTYELIGPKVNKNPEKVPEHRLIFHLDAEVFEVPIRNFAQIRDTIDVNGIEGLVFHHEDGRRMAKIKGRDFGIRR